MVTVSDTNKLSTLRSEQRNPADTSTTVQSRSNFHLHPGASGGGGRYLTSAESLAVTVGCRLFNNCVWSH